MKPIIEKTSFGFIQINKNKYTYDVIITLDGSIQKRKKRSKEIFGTSHIISLTEAEDIFEPGAELLMVGCGMNNLVKLSEEASLFFHKHHQKTILEAAPRAVQRWNEAKGKAQSPCFTSPVRFPDVIIGIFYNPEQITPIPN